MITHVRIQNFRSFLDTEVDLEPFSLVVGANGSGKTNLLRFFEVVTQKAEFIDDERGADWFVGESGHSEAIWKKHANCQKASLGFAITFANGAKWIGEYLEPFGSPCVEDEGPFKQGRVPIFSLVADEISESEIIKPNASVGSSGKGTTQVLDMLKCGDREDLFAKIEESFIRYVPEVEKLRLKTVKEGFRQIHVKEKGLTFITPGYVLSEGTRLILALLTIIHQEKPPAIILLEDIDRGMHPRLFEYIAPLMRDMAVQHDINILATTHNPYLVDAFQDNKKAVIIVEKKDGVSTLTTLEKRLEGLNYDEINPDDMPLGALWYSGIVGGTPAKISHKVEV